MSTWESQDQQYQVLLGHPLWSIPVIYDECEMASAVKGIVSRAYAEMDAGELEPGPVHTRRITREFREEPRQ